MTKYERLALVSARVALGWLFFYAGITKVINPAWSAGGYLKGAKTLAGFYAWLASPGVLPVTNFINQWGLTLLGVSLILGLFVRLTSVLGAVQMVLFWIPILSFPKVGDHSFIVDEHIVYALVLLYFAATRAGRVWGLDDRCAKLPICAKYPKLREWLG